MRAAARAGAGGLPCFTKSLVFWRRHNQVFLRCGPGRAAPASYSALKAAFLTARLAASSSRDTASIAARAAAVAASPPPKRSPAAGGPRARRHAQGPPRRRATRAPAYTRVPPASFTSKHGGSVGCQGAGRCCAAGRGMRACLDILKVAKRLIALAVLRGRLGCRALRRGVPVACRRRGRPSGASGGWGEDWAAAAHIRAPMRVYNGAIHRQGGRACMLPDRGAARSDPDRLRPLQADAGRRLSAAGEPPARGAAPGTKRSRRRSAAPAAAHASSAPSAGASRTLSSASASPAPSAGPPAAPAGRGANSSPSLSLSPPPPPPPPFAAAPESCVAPQAYPWMVSQATGGTPCEQSPARAPRPWLPPGPELLGDWSASVVNAVHTEAAPAGTQRAPAAWGQRDTLVRPPARVQNMPAYSGMREAAPAAAPWRARRRCGRPGRRRAR